MKLQLKQVLDIEGEQLAFSDAPDLSWVVRHQSPLFTSPLRINGSVSNRSGVVTLRYTVEGSLHYSCDRCLADVSRPLAETFEHIVVRALEDETAGDAFLEVPDAEIDLDVLVGCDLQLALPQVLLCRVDCKGICPICGADLNEKPCGCPIGGGDSRFSILNSLLKNEGGA